MDDDGATNNRVHAPELRNFLHVREVDAATRRGDQFRAVVEEPHFLWLAGRAASVAITNEVPSSRHSITAGNVAVSVDMVPMRPICQP